jgi:5-methylcytosine-specific restriction endonuclease McrBC regulatory subunit McrC
MRTVTITESGSARLQLTAEEALALQEAGRRLASDRQWWGDEGTPTERTVIQCHHLTGDEWHVTINNAVGVVIIDNALQINVRPKIPESHLLYLFTQSDVFPRFDDGQGLGAVSESLWEVIAEWFVRATERVVRQDLIKDYEMFVDELTSVRGRVAALESAGAYYAGRMACVCEFDEFTVDTPLNRVLKAAAATVLASPRLSRNVRRRARSLLLRMTDVGILRHADISTQLDRRTAHYLDAYSLARHVLRKVGRSLSAGEVTIWTFLIRTPELVEAGLRQLIKRAIPEHTVVKQGLRLRPTAMTLNPDLVFGTTLAVADVKYKTATEEWKRPDLYQVVTFATAYRVIDAAVIEFAPPDTFALPSLLVGDVNVCHLTWPADGTVSPRDAADSLVTSVRAWLHLATRRLELPTAG